MLDASLCPFLDLAPVVGLCSLLFGLLWLVARFLFGVLWTRTRASRHRDASIYGDSISLVSIRVIALLTRQLDLPVALLL
jgi:hypothetical protein